MLEVVKEFEKDEDYQFVKEQLKEGYQIKNEEEYQYLKEEAFQINDAYIIRTIISKNVENLLKYDNSDINIKTLISELGKDWDLNKKIAKKLIKLVKLRGYPNLYPIFRSKLWSKKENYNKYLLDLFCIRVRIYYREKLEETKRK